MSKRTCSSHTADCSFHHPIFHLTFSKQCRIRHIKCVRARQGGFVTFVKSNAKALSTAVPSIKSTLAPCRGVRRPGDVCSAPTEAERRPFPPFGRYVCARLYPCTNIFQITTIRCAHQIPVLGSIHFHSCLHPFPIH